MRFTPAVFPPVAATKYGSETPVDSDHSTGVAISAVANSAYVNDRDRVVAYNSSGALVQEIGVGSLVDAYGLAVSGFAASFGRLYVPDAGDDTVKVYDPAVSTTIPVATIAGPPGGFTSLVDSAVAVDRVNGDVYVVDQAGSRLSERPESIVQVFNFAGDYEGHLKYNVIDAAPVGLAVDNSTALSQGRIYVTSGNTVDARIYAYPPGAASAGPALPAPSNVASQSELSAGKAPARAAGASAAAEQPPGPASASEIVQNDNLRLTVDGRLSPQKLPRKGVAPISVSLGWGVATTDGTPPPKLKTLRIEINRAGRFDLTGLPTCPYAKIQPASTARALANCRPALVGRGSFSALIALAGQESYVAKGEMLVFNGRVGKKPVLFGQIYYPRPFANSFVIPFRLSQLRKGRYGTALTATMPSALSAWGSLTTIEMRLSRSYRYEGQRRSFLSASCPAPKGFAEALFPMTRTSFDFVGGQSESLTLIRSCSARG